MNSKIDKIKELNELFISGSLTQEEFETLKKEVIQGNYEKISEPKITTPYVKPEPVLLITITLFLSVIGLLPMELLTMYLGSGTMLFSIAITIAIFICSIVLIFSGTTSGWWIGGIIFILFLFLNVNSYQARKQQSNQRQYD